MEQQKLPDDSILCCQEDSLVQIGVTAHTCMHAGTC